MVLSFLEFGFGTILPSMSDTDFAFSMSDIDFAFFILVNINFCQIQAVKVPNSPIDALEMTLAISKLQLQEIVSTDFFDQFLKSQNIFCTLSKG